jgi:hypothetical protein
MGNINDSFPSVYLKANDLKGADVVVIIDHVTTEAVGRAKDVKPIVYFKNRQKGLVLNKTNAAKITTIAGTPETDEWNGVRVVLYPSETEFGGEMVDCIRVKAPTATKAKPGKKTDEPRRVKDESELNGELPGDDDDEVIPF